jgi:putative endonuclease
MSTPAEQREFFVYAMKSLNRDYIYVGLTDNIGRRMSQHNAGHERTTRPYKPFKLILTEAFATRADARRREKFLKSGVGKEFLKGLK